MGVARQESVIRNILDLSKLEKGAVKYRLFPMRVDKLLQEILDDYQSTIELYKVEMETVMPDASIVSDYQMLYHVFSNLINNAIKFRNQQITPKIGVSLEEQPKKVVVRIKDNGIGLSEEEQQRVFERFYQGSASTPGSGIGLAIVKKIVTDLKGRIWLESEGKDQGVTDVVEVPLLFTSESGSVLDVENN